jgi:hypothetical protein
MNTSDYVNLGAGLVLGGMMSRTIGNAFTDALDARTSMNVVTIPVTAAEIQTLLDKLDVRLANGQLSEALYNTLTLKWQARLQALQTPNP